MSVKFDMGQAWREAVAMISANREVMLIVSGVFFFLPSLAAVLLIPAMQPPPGEDPEQIQQFLADFYIANSPYIIGMAIIQTIGLLALLALLRDDSKPTVGDALKIGLTGLLPYIGTQLIVAFAIALVALLLIALPAASGIAVLALVFGVLALIVFFYVMVRLSLTLPVIAIEKQFNPLVVLRRAWLLTKGAALSLFAFYALLVIVFLVISLVASMIIGIPVALLGPGVAAQIAGGIVSGVIGAAGTMVFAAVLAAVHRQLAGPSAGRLSETFE